MLNLLNSILCHMNCSCVVNISFQARSVCPNPGISPWPGPTGVAIQRMTPTSFVWASLIGWSREGITICQSQRRTKPVPCSSQTWVKYLHMERKRRLSNSKASKNSDFKIYDDGNFFEVKKQIFLMLLISNILNSYSNFHLVSHT